MARIGRILAATDFSGAASEAVRRAARVAHDLRAELHVVHVVEGRMLDWLRALAPAGDGDAEPPAVARARAHLDELARLLAQHYSIRTGTHVAIGVPHAAIAAQARAVGADLLVVGAHGLHTYREVFLGSTASRVIRLAAAPVLVVRKTVEDAYQGVLVATDLSARSARAIELALALAPGAYIDVLHAVELPPEGALGVLGLSSEALRAPREHRLETARQGLSALLAGSDAGERLHPVVEEGRPARIVLERAARMRHALVVVGRQGDSTREPGLLGAVAKHVVDDALCDVLVG